MNRRRAAEISVLAGIFGFFIGGLFNFKSEIVDIMMSATVTGVGLAFLVFFAIYAIKYEDMKREAESWGSNPEKRKENSARRRDRVEDKDKGKKVDLIVKDDEDLHEGLYK